MRGWIEDERQLARYGPERTKRTGEMHIVLHALKEAGRLTFESVHEVMSHPESAKRDHTRAAAVILTRAYDDLNGIALLCAEGMPVQAAALAAALWEKAHQANTVTHDPERLAQWLLTTADFDKDNPVYRNKAHAKAFTVVRDFMEVPTSWDDLVAEYKQLCNMKHAHPFVMRHFGVTEWTDDRVSLIYGPTRGGGTTHMAYQTAIACLKALHWGTLGFLLGNADLLDDDAQRRLHRSIAGGFERLEQLKNSSQKLFGEDEEP